jgi:hypothetical protein
VFEITLLYYIATEPFVANQQSYDCGANRRRKDDHMEITYSRVGDYLIPNIKLSDPPNAKPLGRYGRLHRDYLREHRPILYNRLLLSERLYPFCREIDEAAAHRLRTIADKEQAHEIILAELVYN